jgi:NAD(P)-dependent dehydrogenase (short-subunit alcohol dehydrogenase family)
MLAVTGYRSQIVAELRKLLPATEEVVRLDPLYETAPICERYLFCAGLLLPKRLAEQSLDEGVASLRTNLLVPVAYCDDILARNDEARIVVVGSESGFTWSHDGVYAAAKAALHRYVETKKLKPHQQLVCVAPSIIRNTGMTERRKDVENLERRRNEHPKKRFLEAIEVAKLIHFLLYVDDGYLSGQVIRFNGGV